MLPARCAACSSAVTCARVVLLGVTWVVWNPISLFTNSTPLSAKAGRLTDNTTPANNKAFEDISLLLSVHGLQHRSVRVTRFGHHGHDCSDASPTARFHDDYIWIMFPTCMSPSKCASLLNPQSIGPLSPGWRRLIAPDHDVRRHRKDQFISLRNVSTAARVSRTIASISAARRGSSNAANAGTEVAAPRTVNATKRSGEGSRTSCDRGITCTSRKFASMSRLFRS